MNFNRVELGGHLCRDIELRYLPKGTAVGDFSMAVNRRWKDESGEQKEEVSFIDCVAFGKTAETLAQYLKKGDPLFCCGRLRQEVWTDKQTEQKRSKLKVILTEFQFIGGKQDGQQPSRPAANQRSAAQQQQEDGPAPSDGDDSDVPF